LRILRSRQQTGMQFYIESATKKPSYLFARLTDFTTKFKYSLSKMSVQQLETYKDSLRGRLLESPNSLSEETARYWVQIIDGTYRFNFNQEIAKQVQTILLKDVVWYFNSTWIDPKTQRTLTVSSFDKKSVKPKTQVINDMAQFKSKQIYK